MNVELRAGMVSLGTWLGPVSHSRVVALSLPDLYLHSNTLAVKKTKFVITNFPIPPNGFGINFPISISISAKLKWEQDLGIAFNDEEWKSICQKSQTFSFKSRHRLQQFNLIHWIHHRVWINWKMENGSLVHMFWSCSHLNKLWKT